VIVIIKTERLQLVEFDTKYAVDLFELWNDFEVIKYTYMPLLNSIDECKCKIEMFINYTDKKFPNNFIILLDGKAVGIIGSPIINMENEKFGLFYQLSRAYWGKGYISEANKAFIQYLKDAFPNVIIHADAVSINSASIAILKKIGLIQTHIEEEGFTFNNLKLDLVKFSNEV
jgi:ribosomal-protein-alanine N-acetyltransferase